MESLKQQIIQGIPQAWQSYTPRLSLPENVAVVLAVSDRNRSVIFLRVDGHLRSAMPLFNLNSQIRTLGVEPVWLFEGNAFPSTKHMVCSAISWENGHAKASIVNLDQQGNDKPQWIGVAELAEAAIELRLRVVGISAGQRVSVTCTTDQIACSECGATTYRLAAASFYLADTERAPILSLTSHKLGMSVSKLIADEIRDQIPTLSVGTDHPRQACKACCGSRLEYHPRVVQAARAAGSIVLSSLAALELLRHYKSAWYIAQS